MPVHLPDTDQPLLNFVLLRYYEKHIKAKASGESAKYALGYWAEYFPANTVIADITVQKQECFVDWLRDQDKSDGYIKRILGVGRAAMNWAARRGEIDRAPVFIEPPKHGRRDLVLSRDQVAAYLNAIPESEPHAMRYALLLLTTLSRPGAILDLTWKQIDFERDLINLNPPGREQTKKFRPVVPLVYGIMPWLVPDSNSHVITYRGKPVKCLKQSVRRSVARSKLPKETCSYTFRHTMASELRRRSVPKWEVEGILGHSGGSSSDIYAHYDPTYLQKTRAALDSYLSELSHSVPSLAKSRETLSQAV